MIIHYVICTISRKPQLSASHTAVIAGPGAITHCAPVVLPANFHPTFKLCCSTN